MPRHQAISPNRPLTVEIPTTGLEAAIATSSRVEEPADPGMTKAAVTSATDADIRLGERTAFIPMTCQEMQILDRLESGLQQAACLWRDQPEQLEHEKLLGSALYHWQAVQEPGMDSSWVWEVGRWNTQFSLPFALELRRLNPSAMADADQLLSKSTCERNRQIEAAAKRQATSSNCGAATAAAATAATKKKNAATNATEAEDWAEEEPCLCQIRWGLAPDIEAAKRRQIEKLVDDQQQQQQQQQQQHQTRRAGLQKQRGNNRQQPSAPRFASTAAASESSGIQQQQLLKQPEQNALPRRPIVKTSHLRDQWPPAAQLANSALDDPGYGSQGNSPPGLLHQHQQQAGAGRLRTGSSHIGSLLSTACYGGRDWLD